MKSRQAKREARRQKRARIYRLARRAGSAEAFERALLPLPEAERQAFFREAARYFGPDAFAWWRRAGRRVLWLWRGTVLRLHGT